MYVGDGIAIGELQRGVLFEKGDHPRARLKERIDHCRFVALTEFMLEIGAWQLDVFDDAGAAGQRVARHPGPAAGPRRGSAEYRVFLHHDDFQSVPCSGDRSR
ncbi:hypothetical protein D3C84_1026470 [compost metagenome]